jgi:hypothetical protein
MEMDMKLEWIMMIECERLMMNKGNSRSPRTPMADLRTVNLQDTFY